MKCGECEWLRKENQRLHEFTRQLAERLRLASEVLGILAEKKERRKDGSEGSQSVQRG